MSGQFPYPGGPPPPGPQVANPPAMYNGADHQGPPQNFGPPQPNKGGMGGMHNGPPFSGGAPLPNQPSVQPPNRFQPMPPTSQFAHMNVSDPNRAGGQPGMMPPQSFQGPTAAPPQPMGGSRPMRPPTSQFPMGQHPNSNIANQTPGRMPLQPPLHGGQMPPHSNMGKMPPAPSSMGQMPHPPSSVGQMQPPHSSMGQMPPPQSSMGQMPPPQSSMGQMPPPQSSMGQMPPPPSSMGQMPPPPSSMGQMPPPPSSMGQMPPPPSSMGQMPPSSMGQMPPSSMGQMPPPSSMGQMPPPSSMGQMPPPSSMGQMPPPPSSMGGQDPSTFMGHQQPLQHNSGYPGQAMGGQHSMAPPPPQTMHPPSSGLGQMPPPQMGGAMPPNQFPGSAPSFGQQQPAFGGAHQQPAMQPAQRRLDPDQMPSPIQVIEDDKRNRSGVFCTDTKGNVPPLVTTNFITQDRGNANPRFIRSSMYNVPCTADMMKSSHIPFAVAISPFAELASQEQAPPLIDLGELGPVRCKRCKAYMNPYMQFIDGGRRFQCVFCGAATDVPDEYFAHLDHTGKRVDCYNRAELCLGSYEFSATKDYCKNGIPPKEPAFIFMIDVSYTSVKSGLVQLICDRLKSDILVNLPKEVDADESEIRVGFVTYHKELHFYNVKSSLAQPQMMVVSDLEDMFVPLVDGFLVKLSESEAVIDSLLSQIPQLFAESKETELVLGPVIQAGLDALKSSDRSGRLYIFHSGLPTAEAPGKLKSRDDRKLLGTEKEKTVLSPQTTFYNKLGIDCVAAGCCVELFLFPNQYIDIASISDICKITSGNIYKYSYFQADLDGNRFLEDLKHTVMRSQAFDAILRVRTSTGIRPVDFYGNFYMANTTDVEMASIDSDSTVSLEIKHDDKLNEAEGAFIQVAILYTSISGQRRLRCHNLSLNCCSQMADLFRSCESDVLINFFAKQAIRTTLNANPKQVREHIMSEVAQILACYRRNCANPSSAGQLVLPECMKLLPLCSNCIIRSDAISGSSEISTDDRSYLMHLVNAMDVKATNVFFYPRLLPFHNVEMDSSEIPTAIRCSVERLEDSGIYILENGLSMFLWIGHNVSPELIQKIFCVQSAAQVDIDKVQLLELDNPVSRRLNDLIAKLRSERSRYLKLTIVRQRDKLQPWFDHFLVEDKGANSSTSYVDFLVHIHKEIRNILN